MGQLDLGFDAPLHRERDRPPAIRPGDWSAWINRICLRGGVAMAHSALLENLWQCCPEFKASVTKLSDIDTVHLTRWEWYWDRWYPWTAKGGES